MPIDMRSDFDEVQEEVAIGWDIKMPPQLPFHTDECDCGHDVEGRWVAKDKLLGLLASIDPSRCEPESGSDTDR